MDLLSFHARHMIILVLVFAFNPFSHAIENAYKQDSAHPQSLQIPPRNEL
jgi:hypothetical protein